ncbi:MAG TPA: response regulator transcription factor [Paraburkholderia sp.]|uniref:response regulator transcription factor n=1 Tax=Paraburkholderia sp. TaxID=1926495 RepID=UPI002BED3795|nr:response regulator transcription factor [Paraburkholderia sp.]HTR07037.1 response regulator transcription factor [Paraburkholderia sp.]
MAPTHENPVVFVVDDDASIRASVEDLLHSVGLEVRVFASPQEFLKAKRPDAPSCLVLDVRLPEQSGLDFQRHLADTAQELPIVFVTGHGDIRMSVQAMKTGAVEFLAKPFRDQELLDAIQAALERNRTQRREATRVAELRKRFDALTPREREIMPLLILGRLNKQIAAELDVSEATVKVHRGQLMRKMQAKTLPELLRMGDSLGLSGEAKSPAN